jgi:peptidyl-tRNA hydrolase
MALGLSVSSKNIGRNQGNSYAKFAITPHQRGKIMVEQIKKETIGSSEELTKQFTSNFKLTYKRPASIEEVKACVQQRGETLRAYIQRWSIIKNSAVEVSDERAIDAFIVGLRQGDLVKEMGRIKPKTVSNLIDIANRFADGEDVWNNK